MCGVQKDFDFHFGRFESINKSLEKRFHETFFPSKTKFREKFFGLRENFRKVLRENRTGKSFRKLRLWDLISDNIILLILSDIGLPYVTGH